MSNCGFFHYIYSMTGSIFITNSTGWAASNEMMWVVDREILEIDGKKASKHTNYFKIKGLFLYNIELSKEMFVDLVIKMDDSNKVQGFTGVITGITATSVAVRVLTKTERIQEILNKIKEEI